MLFSGGQPCPAERCWNQLPFQNTPLKSLIVFLKLKTEGEMTWAMNLVLMYSRDLVLCVFGGLRIDPRDWHRTALTLTCGSAFFLLLS